MARDFLSGALWGGIASICTLSVISVNSDGPNALPEPVAVAPAAEQISSPESATQAETSQDRITAPQVPAPEPDTLAALLREAIRPAAQPETGAASDLSDPDVEATATPDIETQHSETPVVSTSPATGLEVPQAAPSLSVSTDPEQPAAPSETSEVALSQDPVQPTVPVNVGESSGFGALPDVPEEPQTAPGVETSISVEPDQPQAPEVPEETQAFETPEAEDVDVTGPQEETRIAPLETRDTAEIALADPAPVVKTAPAPQAAEDTQALQIERENTTVAPGGDAAPSIETPLGTVGNLAPEVQINRLPTLGGGGQTDTGTPNQLPASGGRASTPEVLPPVQRFSAAYENAEGKPVMAIVLMDEGVNLSRDTIGLPALRSFPYPISFAVDASLEDAAERMAAYRAEGFEVLATINLPTGALARDAEVSLAVALEAVPEAVGVLEGVGEGVQGTREAAEQVTEILAQTGHGFVTQNKGLNTVQKLAAKSGVPSAVVFRDFDSAGQTPTVIRRFLDQAAFKAGNEGGVIMLGRLREDTISALLIWGLQDRAESVALVPVSAALQTQ